MVRSDLLPLPLMRLFLAISVLWLWGCCPVFAQKVGVPATDAPFTPPQKSKTARPIYPLDAKRARIWGNVGMMVDLDAQGRVTKIEVISPTNTSLDQAAQTAMKDWEFRPATRRGIPIASFTVSPIRFRIDTPGQYDQEGLRREQQTERRLQFNEAIALLKRSQSESDADLKHYAVLEAQERLTDLTAAKIGPAARLLALLIKSGDAGSIDETRVTHLLEQAAEWGDAPAAAMVADRYYLGQGTAKDVAKAASFYQKASEAGSASAACNLAQVWQKDMERPASEVTAQYERAAKLGSPRCQYLLASSYDAGYGVTADPARAYFYNQLAARGGFPAAASRDAGMAAKLTDQQRKAMDEELAQWRPKQQ